MFIYRYFDAKYPHFKEKGNYDESHDFDRQ